MPFTSYRVRALKGVLVKVKLLEEGDLPLLPCAILYAKVLRVA